MWPMIAVTEPGVESEPSPEHGEPEQQDNAEQQLRKGKGSSCQRLKGCLALEDVAYRDDGCSGPDDSRHRCRDERDDRRVP